MTTSAQNADLGAVTVPLPPARATTDSLQLIRDNLPSEILAHPRWVAWDGTRKPDGKLDKTPINPRTGANAMSNTPSTWGTFDEAAECALHTPRAGGVGYVLTESDFIVLDIDKVLGKNAGGAIAPGLTQFLVDIGICSTYAEVSPSGNGLHVFYRRPAKDVLPLTGNKKVKDAFGKDTEIQALGIVASYVTMTGLPWAGCSAGIGDLSPGAAEVLRHLFICSSAPRGVTFSEPFDANAVSPQGEHAQDDLARAEWGLLDAHLLNPDCGYDNWFRIGATLKTLGEVGLRLWIEASRPSKDFDESEIRRKWPGITGSTIACLFGMFDDADPNWRRRYQDARGVGNATYAPPPPASPHAASPAPPSRPWPAPMAEHARHGLAGDFLRMIEPETEADPHALLIQFLAFFGNCIGRSPYLMVGATRHGTNLFAIVAGATARGRKGTSEAEVKRVMRTADEDWASKCIVSGLSSGEGLIDAVRDPRDGPPDKKGHPTIIPGVTDKRLMVSEGEFARVLAQVAREGNVLSSVLRSAWDGETLRVMVRGNPARATDPHVSVVAHVTQFELNARMSETDLFNGLGNRFLWCCSKRTKKLPFGGNVDPSDLELLATEVKRALQHARRTTKVGFTVGATSFWGEAYDSISSDRPGLWGALTARAEAQVLRLALIYALLDGLGDIDIRHLKAALALWKYCDESASYLFGNKLGNPIADRLLSTIRTVGPVGIARTKLSASLGRNTSAAAMSAALQLLQDASLVRCGAVGEGRHSTETWWPL